MYTSVVVFVLGISTIGWGQAFQPGKSCVGWKAQKRMFLVSEVEVQGVTCEVQVQERKSRQGVELEVRFSAATLDSGDGRRDKDVVDLIASQADPSVRLISETLSPSEYAKLWKGERSDLQIELWLQGKSHKLAAQVQPAPTASGKHKPGIEVVWTGTFTELGMEAPSIVGGVVAKVRDSLQLRGVVTLE